MTSNELCSLLKLHGQEHILTFLDRLPSGQQETLQQRLQALDWNRFDQWRKAAMNTARPKCNVKEIQPATAWPPQADTPERRQEYERAITLGRQLLAAGKVGFVTFAGGQGTRLGFNGPKGTFPLSPIRNKSLFQLFAERLIRYGERAGCALHWYIMTSSSTDSGTRAFFAEYANFGYPAGHLHFFQQGNLPAFDFSGRLLLAAPDQPAVVPDGHGGLFPALRQSGALAEMARFGIETLSCFQVDNPLTPMADALFIGLHHQAQAEMSCRVLEKSSPDEKTGFICQADGRTRVIEYFDFPPDFARQCEANGKMRFHLANMAHYLIDRAFAERYAADDSEVLYHRAVKKIDCLDQQGTLIRPAEPNAVKLETFVFDALPQAANPVMLKGIRQEHYAPVKNATGAGSPERCRQALQQLAEAWFRRRGLPPPRNCDGACECVIEISPRVCVDEDDFNQLPLDSWTWEGKKEVYLS